MKKKSVKKNLLFVFAGLATVLLILVHKSGESEGKALQKPIYLNTAYSFEERAADLVSRLTLEEKQSLLGNNMAAVPRMGINSFNVWSEALHGVSFGFSGNGSSPSSFPNSAALGSAWDPDLMQREASAISDEARALNSPVISGLTYYSPVVEPIRDPRWGRTGESYGEDPFLVSQIASGFIRGMMGSDPTYLKTVPCGKHYFANNSEFNRHDGNSIMDSRDMREFYVSPYKALIEKDQLPSIMSSYNSVNGVPTSASKFYLDTLARRTWGMKGYITGDCSAVQEIYSSHFYVKTPEEAAAAALKAGVDIDCGSVYQSSTIVALNKGLVKMADVDKALLNIFTIRMRLGEFDPSTKVRYTNYPKEYIGSKAHAELAKEVATKTPVLLKNTISAKTNKKALPLNPGELKKIALIGPQANKVELGPYSGRPSKDVMISPFAGIKKYMTDKGYSTEVVLAEGGNTASKSNLLYIAGFETRKINGTVTKYDATKYSSASKGITVGAGMGSEFQVRTIDDGSWTAYENVDLTEVDTLGISLNIVTEGGIIEARVGSPEGNLLSTLNATVAAGMRVGGPYGAGKLTKVKVNKLGLNGPQTLYLVYKAPAEQKVDEKSVASAAAADAAIVFVGTDENTATEEADRLSLVLPGNQVELIKAVAAANPNTIVVMQTLGCVEVEEFKNLQNVPGIIWVGYNGQAQGEGIASILFGEANPGGKLNGTWYKTGKDLPDITDYSLRGGAGKNGRTFWYFNKDVSYEFGYGLSYTTFEYSNFKISKNAITPHDKITISVDVKNTGKVEGDEVVQIYMKTPDSPASAQRPIKRLKGFKRVTIPAGQTKTVDIDIDCADLWFWDLQADKMTFDQGKYVFEIGASSKDIKGTVTATMSGKFNPTLKVVVADCGAVVMKNGETAQTSVTAAMTDDSFYDVTKAQIRYVSNNPEVASVDAKGLVTAKGTGVANIIAYVTVDGRTESGSFPIKVMPELKLASVSVDGKKVTAFNADIQEYPFMVGTTSATPKVEAVPVSSNVAFNVAQAKSVPGSAVITLSDNVSVESNQYVVNFGTKSVSDEFNGVLGKQWNWVRENQANYSLSKKQGSLVITSAKGDITTNNNNAENILLQSANTNWVIDSKIVFSKRPSGMSQNGGLLAYQDDDNFVKLVYSAGFGGRRGAQGAGAQAGNMMLVVEENGFQKSAASLSMGDIIKNDNTLFVKFEKKGNQYTASVSADGKKYTTVGSAKVLLTNIKAGLIVCEGVADARMRGFGGARPGQPAAAPDNTPFEVMYDYFKITNSGLK